MYLEEHKLPNDAIIPLYHFSKLDDTRIVKHCFTTRLGGTSHGIFESLNLSFTRGDDKECVIENYKRVAYALESNIDDFVCSDQTHTTNVLRVGLKEKGYGLTKDRKYTDVDGLVTNECGVVLATFFADCVPLYFVDPAHKAIGLSHSGWRGTVNRMGKVTIEKMKKEFGSEAKDIICAIGPSICKNCYEISEEVADLFAREFIGHEDEILVNKGNGKYMLDLWKTNEIILREAGIFLENIEITDKCTCCNPTVLFSHRASKGKRGNLGAFLCLKD